MGEKLETAQKNEATNTAVDGVVAGTPNEEEGFEFTDTTEANEAKETAQNSTEESKKVAQTKGQNQEFARKRREQEKQALIKKTREQAIIEALGGKNPFTGEEMKDSVDVDEYLAMREIEKSGGDPLNDFRQKAKEKQKEVLAQQEAEAEKSNWFKKDKEDFANKHPDVKLDELIENKKFQLFAKGKVGVVPLSEIYENFQELESAIRTDAEQTITQKVANAQSTPGGLSNGQAVPNDFFTKEQVSKMSPSEITKNLDKINKSMKKW